MNTATLTASELDRLDALVAEENWEEFATETLCSEEGAMAIVYRGEIVEELIRAAGMDQAAVLGFADQPFRFGIDVFKIRKAICIDGKAVVEVTPTNTEFEAEVCRRIENNRFHTLDYCRCFGFICFPEDYMKYQG